MNVAPESSLKELPPDMLADLEKKYRRSKKKLLFMLLIPVLWCVGFIPAYFIRTEFAWELLAGWCITVTFLIGIYIVVRMPVTDEVVHNYSQLVLPVIFEAAGAEDIRVSKRHDLSMKTFLESGLYHDKYNAISREDAIQGKIHGNQFGMYEVAMQVGITRMNARTGIFSGTRTNHFYGWFIVTNCIQIKGFHFITLRKKLNSGESDDWIKKSISHWENDKLFHKVRVGNSRFDELFMLNSDQPQVLLQILDSSAQDFLIYLAETSANAFAISIQRGRIYLLIGHEKPEFRKVPESNFATQLNPEMVADAKWFVDLIRGIGKTVKI